MLKLVEGPHLLRIYKIYEGENNIYCVGDHYSGGTLYDYIKQKGKPSEAQSISIIRQLLEALVYLEEKGLMHRDIKPENILFEDETYQSVAMVDFGFMTRISEYNKLFTRCGTPGYVAPEVLADKQYDNKADVYSLGLLFYILVTNTNPFYNKSYSKLIHKNKSGSVDFQLVQDQELDRKIESKRRSNFSLRCPSKNACKRSC